MFLKEYCYETATEYFEYSEYSILNILLILLYNVLKTLKRRYLLNRTSSD